MFQEEVFETGILVLSSGGELCVRSALTGPRSIWREHEMRHPGVIEQWFVAGRCRRIIRLPG